MHSYLPSMALLAGLVPLVSACGETDPAAASDSKQVLYAITTRITLPESQSTVVTIVDSLEPGVADVEKGVPTAGIGAAHGTPDIPGAFFVGSAEEPVLTRYGVAPDGSISREESVSLAEGGLSRAPRSVVFASGTKAYAISAETHQVFVWNPQEMTLDAILELGEIEREGFAPAWVFRALVREGKLLVPITWIRTEGDPGAAPDSAIVSIDVETDEIQVLEEKRCGGLRAVHQGGGGDLYFTSTAGAPATWRRLYGGDAGPESCIVRMRAGENRIDPDFLVRPDELAEGRLAVDFSPAGPSHLVFQALDEELFPITSSTAPEELWGAAAWRFWSVPLDGLAQGEVEPVSLDVPASALNALRFEVDGRSFVPQIEADYSETTLVDVTDPTALKQGPTIQGSVGGVFRVR